jgi:GTP-binding protein LepA
VGAILQLCEDRRGIQKNLGYISPTRVMITYELPFAEVLLDFYDKLKSVEAATPRSTTSSRDTKRCRLW